MPGPTGPVDGGNPWWARRGRRPSKTTSPMGTSPPHRPLEKTVRGFSCRRFGIVLMRSGGEAPAPPFPSGGPAAGHRPNRPRPADRCRRRRVPVLGRAARRPAAFAALVTGAVGEVRGCEQGYISGLDAGEDVTWRPFGQRAVTTTGFTHLFTGFRFVQHISCLMDKQPPRPGAAGHRARRGRRPRRAGAGSRRGRCGSRRGRPPAWPG